MKGALRTDLDETCASSWFENWGLVTFGTGLLSTKPSKIQVSTFKKCQIPIRIWRKLLFLNRLPQMDPRFKIIARSNYNFVCSKTIPVPRKDLVLMKTAILVLLSNTKNPRPLHTSSWKISKFPNQSFLSHAE